MHTHTKVFQVNLGASRIIYNPNSRGVSLLVSNMQEYPVLIQGKVYAEDKTTIAPFIITPPLSRLDAQQKSLLRIIRTGGQFAEDRETLQWLCVSAIPPKDTDVWAQDKSKNTPKDVTLNMEVSANSCIKLLLRPSALKGSVMNAASELQWQRQGNTLIATNPSAFYINLNSLKAGKSSLPHLSYIAPFASRKFTLPKGASGQISWSIITDEGGTSHTFQTDLP